MNKVVKQTAAILLACTMMGGVIPANVTGGIFSTSITASALMGKGTMYNPYIADTYDELMELIAPKDYKKHNYSQDTDIYVKLGADIYDNTPNDSRDFNIFSDTDAHINIHLDLAGKKLSRYAYTIDSCLFYLDTNSSLTIDDSIGGGSIVFDTKTEGADAEHLNAKNIFIVKKNAELTIKDGTFEMSTRYNNFTNNCIKNNGGTVTINGGTFKSYRDLITTSTGKTIINNGTFHYTGWQEEKSKDPLYRGLDATYIKNCRLIADETIVYLDAYDEEGSSKNVKDIIPEKAVVKINGEVVAHNDLGYNDPNLEVNAFSRSRLCGKEITIETPAIKEVNISLTEPKAGENIKNAAVVESDNVKIYRMGYDKREDGIVYENRFYDAVNWYCEGDLLTSAATFEAGKEYDVLFFVENKEDGETLADDTKIYVNGKEAKKEVSIYPDRILYGITFECKGSELLLGDVNGDGVINVTDISKAAAHVKGKKLLTGDALKRADVNSDGVVNVTDVTKIAAHVKGKKLLTSKK
ncbi:dockerin type I repeat-containing protein [Ruminococcus albus]|uniref:Dockerin domain-containing protein n=1 Tax=Ruminococcus albus TaxID=1264 RepID=A0A1I1EKE1_RUMAL|nr:dockerin type I repeat-containing protein [Ruminococcus albus]SFB87092.1 hypothetical protein SAMN02910406_00711 [Ruminococcus albus]